MLGGRPQYFHVISRIVGRALILGEQEKSFFLNTLRRFEGFTGVEVLSLCIMDNHFHLLLFVPQKPEEIPDEEVIRRMRFIYPKEKMAGFLEKFEEEEANGNAGYREKFLNDQRERMYDLSGFVKEIKQRFSRWYNKNNDRTGTLWDSRFRSVVVEGSENALLHVAAYIELNPVRAGIVGHPRDYRWCSYAMAVSGGKTAQAGIRKLISGRGNLLEWKAAMAAYSKYFEDRSYQQAHRRKAVDSKERLNSETPATEAAEDQSHPLLTRVRYFTEGLILGSRGFVENFFQEVTEPFRKRLRKAHPFLEHDAGEVCSYRRFRS